MNLQYCSCTFILRFGGKRNFIVINNLDINVMKSLVCESRCSYIRVGDPHRSLQASVFVCL